MGQFPEASQLLKGLHAGDAIFIWSAASSIQKENFWTEDELLIQKHKKYCWKWNLGNEILSDNTAFQLPYALWDNWIKVQWSQGQATLCWHSDIMIQYYIIKKINRSWLYHDVTLTAECTAQCYPYLCSCEHDQLSCPRKAGGAVVVCLHSPAALLPLPREERWGESRWDKMRRCCTFVHCSTG